MNEDEKTQNPEHDELLAYHAATLDKLEAELFVLEHSLRGENGKDCPFAKVTAAIWGRALELSMLADQQSQQMYRRRRAAHSQA